jgi:hypothetical protein
MHLTGGPDGDYDHADDPRPSRQLRTFLANWEMPAARVFSTSRLASESSGCRHAKTPWRSNKTVLTSVGNNWGIAGH